MNEAKAPRKGKTLPVAVMGWGCNMQWTWVKGKEGEEKLGNPDEHKYHTYSCKGQHARFGVSCFQKLQFLKRIKCSINI